MPHLGILNQRSGLWLSPDLTHLDLIRQKIADAVQRCPSVDHNDPEITQIVCEIQLAATELLSNIIRHGFPQAALQPEQSEFDAWPNSIHVSVFVNKSLDLVVQVAHSGMPFNGNQAEIQEITEPMEGQMGLYIISKCVDHFYYAGTESGSNYVWLFRRLQAAASGTGA